MLPTCISTFNKEDTMFRFRNLRITTFTGIVCTLLLTFYSPLHAQTPSEKGRQIMEEVDALPAIEKMLSETILDIFDSQNSLLFSKRSRTANYTKNFRDPDKKLARSISYFYAPADDRGNGALMIENAEGEDDQWIYLKGLRKPKRVIGSDKSSSFMGSDFSNGDVAARDIDDSNYVWLATEKVAFKDKAITVEKIEGAFKDPQMKEDYGYSKSIVWIHPSSGLPFKMEMYDLNGQLYKQASLLAFTIHKNKDGKKVFIPTSMEMKNVLKGTRTVMTMKNIRTGEQASQVKPEIFDISYLTRKWW